MMPQCKCQRCKGTLIEIDHYGQRLIGCIECNRDRDQNEGQAEIA